MLFSASFSFSQHKANVPLNKQIKNDNSEMSDNNANNSNSDIIKELLKSNKNFINNSNKKQDFSDQRELTSTKGTTSEFNCCNLFRFKSYARIHF